MSVPLPHVSDYKRLGTSGLKVSPIILGCMSYGNSKWAPWVLDEEDSLRHFEAAFKMGINTWDTANTYSNGDSEVLIGKAIKKFDIPREELVIMTKVHAPVFRDKGVYAPAVPNPDQVGYVNQHGLSRKHIFDSIKASLTRMNLEFVDVLQCHRFDYNTPIEETMDALHDVVKAGFARYIGMSSCFAYQFHQMQNYAKSRGQTQFVSMQNFHNALYREEEREMFAVCKLFGVACIPWSPLGRGFLTRPSHKQDTSSRYKTDPACGRLAASSTNESKVADAINQAIYVIAERRRISMAQVAIAWSMSQPGITAPIVGSTRIDSLVELVQATHINLSIDEIDSISSLYVSRPIIGHS